MRKSRCAHHHNPLEEHCPSLVDRSHWKTEAASEVFRDGDHPVVPTSKLQILWFDSQ